jgi:transposase-like protein
VVTTAGPVELERARVRNARELGPARLSVRDVEAALAETFDEPVIGKSTVARVCQDTRERYRRWCERRLEEHDLVYVSSTACT